MQKFTCSCHFLQCCTATFISNYFTPHVDVYVHLKGANPWNGLHDHAGLAWCDPGMQSFAFNYLDYNISKGVVIVIWGWNIVGEVIIGS